MRMSYNGLLSQPSKLMTRVRLPSSALKRPFRSLFFASQTEFFSIIIRNYKIRAISFELSDKLYDLRKF